jgi:xanthine/CO dehydrogenase XdhC/CoxF family maturation factor
MDPATLVLVPVGWALWQLGGKIQDLRHKVARQDELISAQQQAIAVLQTQGSGTGGKGAGSSSASSVLVRTVAWSGAAVSAGLVAVNVVRVLQARREADRRVASEAPAGYQSRVAESDASACVICHEHERDTLMQPCKHFGYCWPCAQRLSSMGQGCPICRGPIASLVFVYHA